MLKELGKREAGVSDVALRRACRAFAEKWIANQRADFMRLGILGSWDRPYETMDFAYQAEIARAFGVFVSKGLVTFGSSRSSGAQLRDRSRRGGGRVRRQDDPSIFVAFLSTSNREDGLASADDVGRPSKVSAVIWTTDA